MQRVQQLPALGHRYEAPPTRAPNAARRPHRVRATPHEQRDIWIAGMRLRYIDVAPTDVARPDGTILLIHGHTSRIEEYDALVPTLARRHRVIVPDLPGCGYSDKPERDYTLSFYEDTLLSFLDALRVERAYLGGGSLGGNLVLRLGHRVPDRFPKLVAWAPAGAWEPQPAMTRLGQLVRGNVLFWPVVWAQSRFWFHRSWPGRGELLSEVFAYYREVHGSGFVRMYWGIALDQLRQSLFGRAPYIAQPTLLLWGDRDRGMRMGEGVKRLQRLLPRARLHVFENACHSLACEVPDKLSQVMADFLHGSDGPVTVG